MYIQYIGFTVAARSRIYNYDVLDTKQKREFTVQVQSEGFRPSGLKLQDVGEPLEIATCRIVYPSTRVGSGANMMVTPPRVSALYFKPPDSNSRT